MRISNARQPLLAAKEALCVSFDTRSIQQEPEKQKGPGS